MSKIQSLDELKELAESEPTECFIALNGGMRSSKTIQYWEDGIELDDEDADNIEPGGTMHAKWLVLNEIDDSEEAFETDEELLEQTHIGEALEKNALFRHL